MKERNDEGTNTNLANILLSMSSLSGMGDRKREKKTTRGMYKRLGGRG